MALWFSYRWVSGGGAKGWRAKHLGQLDQLLQCKLDQAIWRAVKAVNWDSFPGGRNNSKELEDVPGGHIQQWVLLLMDKFQMIDQNKKLFWSTMLITHFWIFWNEFYKIYLTIWVSNYKKKECFIQIVKNDIFCWIWVYLWYSFTFKSCNLL